MVQINTISIIPPLLNSSCAWSSDLTQLENLYDSAYTGAVTTRTAVPNGFEEDEKVHSVAFSNATLTTLNSYGYSPHPLADYLSWVKMILTSPSRAHSIKPFIISITASDPLTLRSMVEAIQALRSNISDIQIPGSGKTSRIAIELNTSCPNIPNATPSGYSIASLKPLLQVLADARSNDSTLTIGLKLPPFIYRAQFVDVLETLKSLIRGGQLAPVSFFTCTNTLGNSLLFSDQVTEHGKADFAVPTALGGLAGESLHALSLGNVFSFSQLLSAERSHNSCLGSISIIGVGGVTSKAAVARMVKAGAAVVGCASLFGREGVRAFEKLQG